MLQERGYSVVTITATDVGEERLRAEQVWSEDLGKLLLTWSRRWHCSVHSR
jgi:hypothetical protein